MKKSIIKTVVLAALMALPMFAKAQTFAGITAEQNAQNTPKGWTAVELPQLPTITSGKHVQHQGLWCFHYGRRQHQGYPEST